MAPLTITEPPSAAAAHRKTRLAAALGAVLALVAAMFVFASSANATIALGTSYAATVLKLMNQERAANHLAALKSDARLISSAYKHNVAMAGKNSMSHQVSGEAGLGTRIDRARFPWTMAAENIGWTTARSATGSVNLQRAMYNEKAPNNGHRLNILSRNYRYVGVSIIWDSRTRKLWLTEDFARA